MATIEDIFRAYEMTKNNKVNDWIINGKYPETRTLRLDLYKNFNWMYHKKHEELFESYQRRYRISFYYNYLKTFDRYKRFYKHIKEEN